MKRSYLIFFVVLPILFLSSAFYFSTNLKLTFVDWTLREYCKKSLGYQMTYDKMTLLKHNVIQIEGLLLTPSRPDSFSFGKLSSPIAFVKANFDLRSKAFDSQMYLQDFELNIDQSSVDLEKGFALPSGNRGFIIKPSFSISGDGVISWGDEMSHLMIDLSYSNGVQGMAQIDELAIDIIGNNEPRQVVFKGQDLNAPKIVSLGKALFPDYFSPEVTEGKISGALVVRSGALFGALEAEDLKMDIESLELTAPHIKVAAHQGVNHIFFESATLKRDRHFISGIEGALEFDQSDWSLKGKGDYQGITLTTDVKSSGFHFYEGSVIKLESKDLFGEISLLDHKGKVILRGKKLPLESLDPFVAWNGKLSIEACADLRGEWQDSKFIVHGSTNDLLLVSDEWNFSTFSPSLFDICMDSESGTFDVSGKINKGNFEHYPSDLKLGEIDSLFHLTSRQISFENLLASCGPILVGGEMIMTLKPALDIEIYQHTLQGKISDVKEMLETLGVAPAVFSLPITGELTYQDEGAFFKWNQSTGKFQGTIGATLQNGSLQYSNYDLFWNDLSLNFVYDISSDFLEIRDGRGNFRFGENEDLNFVIDRFICKELSEGLVDFDFWCGDKKRDKIRVSGNSYPTEDGILINFNPETTHFGALYPEKLEMLVGGNGSLKKWNLDMNFSWEEVKHELQQLMRAKMTPFHQNLQLLLSDTTEGEFGIAINYEDVINYKIIGKEILFGDWAVSKFKFLGSSYHDQWKIQQCEMDDLSIAADLALEDDGYRVSFLGCRLGNISLIGMDGKFFPDRNQVEANLNLVEINLAELKKIGPLKGFVKKYQPQGEARANAGKLNIQMKENDWTIDLSFIASLKNFSLQGIPFHDSENIAVEFQTDKQLTIKNVSSFLGDEKDCILLELESAGFDLCHNELSVQGLHFQIPPSRMGWVTNFMRSWFPGAVNASLSNFLDEIKGSSPLEGDLNFELNPVSSYLAVYFNDGHYQLLDKTYCLKDFQFYKKDHEIEIFTKCLAFNTWFDLKTRFLGKTFPHGILEVQSLDNQSESPLSIFWKKGKNPENRLEIEKISGTLADFDIALNSFDKCLKGTIKKENFAANLEVSENKICFQNAQGSFLKGSFRCPYGALTYSNQHWEISIPKVYGCRFHLGHFDGWQEFLDSSLIVDNFEVCDIQGSIDELDQITCYGKALFSSEEKQKRMFPFVKEKIRSISSLKPSSGQLEFCLDSGDIILTRFRNVVDGRRLFRYTLPVSYKNSIGMDGALSLIFNLTPHNPKVRVGDLISVVVEGTIENPKFSLKRTTDVTHVSQ